MTKTIQFSEAGEPSVLSIIDESVPAPAADEVQILVLTVLKLCSAVANISKHRHSLHA